MARVAGHAALFGAAAPAPVPAAAKPTAAKPTAAGADVKHGTLDSRNGEIPRQASGILDMVHNWENRAVVPYQKINKMNHPLKLMITNEIRPILAELEKTGHHMKTVKGQFRGYFEASAEP
eukprot:7386471-Prymnesium_polylepis.1